MRVRSTHYLTLSCKLNTLQYMLKLTIYTTKINNTLYRLICKAYCAQKNKH